MYSNNFFLLDNKNKLILEYHIFKLATAESNLSQQK